MNSLERLKEAAEHPGSYINGPDIALALKVVEAARAFVESEPSRSNNTYKTLEKALAALTEDK